MRSKRRSRSIGARPAGHCLALIIVFLALAAGSAAQNVVDKTVATVSDGIRTELITYSDLKWELALKQGVPLSPPRSDDLNLALTQLINQRIFALEAKRIPRPDPTEEEVDEEVKRILRLFPSTAELVRRLEMVGFSSIKDHNFQRMIGNRVSIEKFVDFRFRSFVVNTPDEESKYYNDVYVKEFRDKYKGLVVPSLEEKREEIDKRLTEAKVLANIEAFLDDSKRRVEIVILKPV